jgi:cytochrome b involved in lipid metabolism
MNKNFVFAGAIVIFIIISVGVYILTSNSIREEARTGESTIMEPIQKDGDDSDAMQKSTVMEADSIQSYTLDDIAEHAKAEDCYMAIEGKVYDMTPYIQKQMHPGGAAILFGCGKDSTVIFNLRPKDNKPHSKQARSTLEKYYIGELSK